MPLYISVPCFFLWIADGIFMFYSMNANHKTQKKWDAGALPTTTRVMWAFGLFFVFGIGAFAK